MKCYLFKQENEEFKASNSLEIDSKISYIIDEILLIVTKEKLFTSKILKIEDSKIVFDNLKEIELSSVDFKNYIIENLFKEKDKEELDEKYHYLLEGKEGAISVLGFLEVVKKRTKDYKTKLFRGHSSTSWKLEPSLYRPRADFSEIFPEISV